jgi:hypothetical protein
VALLDYLGGALSTSPVVAVATVRDDSAGSSIAPTLSRIPGAIHLRLGPLNYAEAAVLIEERPELNGAQRQLLIKRADGVPLLIEELLGAVKDSTASASDIAPASFASHAWLDALGSGCRRLTCSTAPRRC